MITTRSRRSQKTKTTEHLVTLVKPSMACTFRQVAPEAAIWGSSSGESLLSVVKGGWRHFKRCRWLGWKFKTLTSPMQPMAFYNVAN